MAEEQEPEALSRNDVDALVEAGAALMEAQDWAQALPKLEEAAAALEGFHEPMESSRLRAKIGECQLELSDYAGALKTFERQLESATSEKDKAIRREGQASAHANLAHAHVLNGQPDEALGALEASDGLLRDMPVQEARNASLAGAIHFARGDAPKALVSHQKDLELSDASVRKEGANPVACVRAKHNCAVCLMRMGKVGPAREAFDECAKLLDLCIKLPEDALSLFRGATVNALHARALYHAALASRDPRLDAGARPRLERAAALLPPPPPAEDLSELEKKNREQAPATMREAWPGRAEDALLGAFVLLALCRQRLRPGDDFDLGAVEVMIDDARRYAVVARALAKGTTAVLIEHALAAAQAKARAVGGDPTGAADAFQAALDALADGEKRGCFKGPAGEPAMVALFGTRAQGDVLRSERRSCRVGRGACLRKGVGLGLYGSIERPTAKELVSALAVCEAAIEKDDPPRADDDALGALGHVGACLRLQGKSEEGAVEFEERLARATALETENGETRQRRAALRLLGDAADADGDAVTALRTARKACALDSADADAAKRLVAAYVAVGNKLSSEDRTKAKEVLTFTKIWNLEPGDRDALLEDEYWVAANAKNLAKVALEGYRGALEAA